MIKLYQNGVYVKDNSIVDINACGLKESEIAELYKNTIAYGILKSHDKSGRTEKNAPLNIKFDCLASHDITYVGIIQTAKASGLKKFPVPYVLTNCHNSLCAVGGTINEDDHIFGLSAAKKYGGIFVPPHQAVIHTYMRERMAASGKMILGSDSHTRYGALGTMAIGEGGPEIVKQLLERTYDITYPEIIGVRLSGNVRKGVGPQDVALAIIKATFKIGFVKNKVMEFFGEGIKNLPIEFRNGIDVMTTETTCLSSIWETDDRVFGYLKEHKRESEYHELKLKDIVFYDGLIDVDLSKVEPMIALPFHPSNVYSIRELVENPYEILEKCEEDGAKLLNNPKINFKLTDKIVDGKIKVDQAIIAGCAGGTYDNIYEASVIMKNKRVPNSVSMSVYCGSQPIYLDLMKKGVLTEIVKSGAIVKTSFCGPCFGAGDVPQNNGFSIRHTTRNFESREGSKPSDGQIASVALMDARSIAATVANGGYLTSALNYDYDDNKETFTYDESIYTNRIYDGYQKGNADLNLVYGPNIADWPTMIPLQDNLIMKMCAVIDDAVTTTDELIPSGETSSYRSNPLRLAEFALSRKVPDYVKKAKVVKIFEENRRKGILDDEIVHAINTVGGVEGTIEIGSVIFANKPGDGSAREQAASCQRVLGGIANIAVEYATKRYRSNLINWGMLPFRYNKEVMFENDDIVIVKNVKTIFEKGKVLGLIVRGNEKINIELFMDNLTETEKEIILKGSLINYNNKN